MKSRVECFAFVLVMCHPLSTYAFDSPAAPLEQRLSCPSQLAVRDSLADVAAPWKVLVRDVPHQLSGLALYLGEPSADARLAPDKEHRLNRTTIDIIWSLNADDARNHGFWIECSYEATATVVTTRIGSSARECRTQQHVDSSGSRSDSGTLLCSP